MLMYSLSLLIMATSVTFEFLFICEVHIFVEEPVNKDYYGGGYDNKCDDELREEVNQGTEYQSYYA